MKILEAEVALREDTRVAEQAKPALEAVNYSKQAHDLGTRQSDLRDRVLKVGQTLTELPKGVEHFGREIGLMAEVASVMGEATTMLRIPDTGTPTIAAETEVIELLLEAKKMNSKGGGGGGASPGQGSGGTTNDAALALLGRGVNDKEVREERDVGQSTGSKGAVLPEEFRLGLDEYFNRLEKGKNQ